MAINIENNRRISGKLGRRDYYKPQVSNIKEPRKPDTKPKEEDSLKQILKAIKDLKPGESRNNRVVENDRASFNNFNKLPRMLNYPYNTQWNDGKPILPERRDKPSDKTPNPLHKNSVNMIEDVPWCIICQSPHDPYYCVVAQSVSIDGEQENNDEESYDDQGCAMTSSYIYDETDSTEEDEGQDVSSS